MVQSLEAIKGGGGSIRVGTTGTISSLMTRELDSMRAPYHKPLSSSSMNKLQTAPRKSSEIGQSSSFGTRSHDIGIGKKAKGDVKIIKNRHKIPMLASNDHYNNNNISVLDTTPSRETSNEFKKGPTNFVEVVDIKCGSLDNGSRANWTVPITSKLRKLGFSKLSESVV